jgi:hypothetical protein
MIAEKMKLDFKINNFDELREEIFTLFPDLLEIDNCIEGGNPKEFMAEEIKEHIFYNSVENFWLTNSIARSSKILCDRNEFSSNGVLKI